MTTTQTPRLTVAQREALRFLAGPNVATDGAQIRIRTARPLIALGLVESRPGHSPDQHCGGGWTYVLLTQAGRDLL